MSAHLVTVEVPFDERQYYVAVIINGRQMSFRVDICGQELITVRPEERFWAVLADMPGVASEILDCVLRFYRGDYLRLPLELAAAAPSLDAC